MTDNRAHHRHFTDAMDAFLSGTLLDPPAAAERDWVAEVRATTSMDEMKGVARDYMQANGGNGYGMPTELSVAFREHGDALRKQAGQ
ncbi:hypothetical protein [Nocardiopsis sp. YSL2]|uniref:hypothetical protein n=1 Tax=Nocardiopsis sp. YSL2 TaxID=2939492 RepID=UPI0026F43E42|nr:hypothetical protein [Nocardiopsis sp. YSL2]